MEQPDQRSAKAVAESRHSKPFFAGIRVQGLHGVCRTRGGHVESICKRLSVRATRRSTGTPLRATSTMGHGTIGLHNAIVDSCNVFFYNVGKELGIDRISHYATMMGLGRKTGIDLPNEDPGLIPSAEWKQQGVERQRGMREKQFRLRSDRATSASRRCRRHGPWADSRSGGRLKQPHLVNPREALAKLGFPAG